jgi:hypothetical protein
MGAEFTEFALVGVDSGCTLTPVTMPAGCHRLRIPPSSRPSEDDELQLSCLDSGSGARKLTLLIRRTNCKITTALLGQPELLPQTQAALLWYGWKRCHELCGLKRFNNGFSGSDVLVFRPMLGQLERGSAGGSVHQQAWGSCLLVKTGSRPSLEMEWRRFQSHLSDRIHPFMARTEHFLQTRPPRPHDVGLELATLIGTFLGGDLLQVESLESQVRGTVDTQQCEAVLDKLSSVMANWYAGASVRPLGTWSETYSPHDGRGVSVNHSPYMLPQTSGSEPEPRDDAADRPFKLFGKYDFGDDAHRHDYSAGVAWDISFIREEHLFQHLLGKQSDGLLYRLMAVPVRFSLVHGDLHPRNILVGRQEVWLLDFGETGIAPTLFDFAKLEVYVRLWCVELGPARTNIEDAATLFEILLLDQMTGSESNLGSVCPLAEDLGATEDSLLKLARCIARIRQQALVYSVSGPDRRDYLAVLYLTVLETLSYAGKEPNRAQNHCLLMALSWLLEDRLSRIVGLEPFPRPRAALDHKKLLSVSWLKDSGAPGRVCYFLDREDGRKALAPLMATRGVLQSQTHHLDVFDHTLLVLAYLEALLDASDPLAGFFDHDTLDKEVDEALRIQQLLFPPILRRDAVLAETEDTRSSAVWKECAQWLTALRDPTTKAVLKWGALFHDVGKPATRCLNVQKGKAARIQFIGHEIFGLQLVAEHLAMLFPDDPMRRRVEHIIRRHHDHHLWVNRYAREKVTVFATMKKARSFADIPLAELVYLSKFWDECINPHAEDFPVLVLHGYADSLACRGPEMYVPMGQVAAIDLEMLRLYTIYKSARMAHDPVFHAHFQQLKETKIEPTRELVGRLRPWLLYHACERVVHGKTPLTFEEILKKAKQMNSPNREPGNE